MQQFRDAAPSVIVDLAQKRRLRRGLATAPRESAPTVRCQECKDAGYLRANVPFGHPLFGKAIECQCLLARRKETHRQKLWEQSNLDRLAGFQETTFESFQFWLPGVQEGYEAALAFADARTGWLVLQGTNGCGKTHLAVAVARQCLDNGAVVLFMNIPDLLRSLRATLSPGAEEHYDREFSKMCEAEVLVLDDLGVEQGTPWAIETLYLLFNHRYAARLATVVTTNHVDLVGIDPRIRSRLRDRRLVRTVIMDGAQDFRELEG